MFTVTAQKNLKRRLGEKSMGGSPTKVRRIIMSSLPDRMIKTTQSLPEEKPDTTLYNVIKPEITRRQSMPNLKNLSSSSNMNSSSSAPQLVAPPPLEPEKYPSYSDLQGFFHPPTQAEIDAYGHDILTAVRNQDLETLRKFKAAGRPMKCSNEFGESILHLACRKGLLRVAHFLIEEAQIALEVCDDYGRNCMHDAAWVQTPNFELIDLVLGKCPDLLYIKDRRGHTPLAFARKDQWKCWNDYFKTKTPEFLMPKQILDLQQQQAKASCAAGPASAALAAAAATNETPKTVLPLVAKTGMKIPVSAATAAIPKVAAKGMKIPVLQPDQVVSVKPKEEAPVVIKLEPKEEAPAVVKPTGIHVLLQAASGGSNGSGVPTAAVNPAIPQELKQDAPAAVTG